jgi:hypothetical protein
LAITFYQSYVTCLTFFYRKGVGFYSPTPNIIEPHYLVEELSWFLYFFKNLGIDDILGSFSSEKIKKVLGKGR